MIQWWISFHVHTKTQIRQARRRFLFLLPIFKIGAITSIIIIISYGKYSSGKYIHWVHAHANTFLMAAEWNHFNWVELEEANVCVPVQLNSKLERAKKRTLEKNIKNSNAFDIHLSILQFFLSLLFSIGNGWLNCLYRCDTWLLIFNGCHGIKAFDLPRFLPVSFPGKPLLSPHSNGHMFITGPISDRKSYDYVKWMFENTFCILHIHNTAKIIHSRNRYYSAFAQNLHRMDTYSPSVCVSACEHLAH